MTSPVVVPPDPRPYLCVWEITLACNASCAHCGSAAGDPRESELTTGEALALVDGLADLGCRTVTLSGGEPLLRPDWPVLARRIRTRGMDLELITNGLEIVGQAAEIAEAGFRAVSISIDGPDAVHDALRGTPGALARAIDGARELRRLGVRTGAVTQVGTRNVGAIGAIHDMLVDERFEGWQVQLTLPHGRARGRDLCLSPRDLSGLERELIELIRRGDIFLQAADTIGWMSPGEPLLRTGTPRGNRVWGSCQAGLRAVGVTSDGTVRGCLSMPPHFDEGNVRERPLAAIWRDPDAFAYNRRFDEGDLEGECAACPYGRICRAGCTCLAWSATGGTGHNPYCLLASTR